MNVTALILLLGHLILWLNFNRECWVYVEGGTKIHLSMGRGVINSQMEQTKDPGVRKNLKVIQVYLVHKDLFIRMIFLHGPIKLLVL